MSALPLWLQTTGIIVGVVTGITGVVLGILNVVWRRQASRPNLTVSWEQRSPDRPYPTTRAYIVVRNEGHVAVTIVDVFFRMVGPSDEERIARKWLEDPDEEGLRASPIRLEPSERRLLKVRFGVHVGSVDAQRWRSGEYHIVATVVDALGNHYEAEDYRLELIHLPTHSGE